MNLGEINIFKILRLLNHEHILHLCLFGSSLISLSKTLSFLAHKFSSYIVRYIPKYFVFWGVVDQGCYLSFSRELLTFASFERNIKVPHWGEFILDLLLSLNISCEHQWEPVENTFEKVQTPLISGTPGDFTIILTHTWPLKLC